MNIPLADDTFNLSANISAILDNEEFRAQCEQRVVQYETILYSRHCQQLQNTESQLAEAARQHARHEVQEAEHHSKRWNW